MPRPTMSKRQRRLNAYAQRQREWKLSQLAGELRMLWRQHVAAICAAGEEVEYIDSKLVRRDLNFL